MPGPVPTDDPIGLDAGIFPLVDDYRRALDLLYWRERSAGDAGDHLTTAEAVIAARTALCRYLMDRGWTPPAGQLRGLHRDEATAREGNGAIGG